MLILIQRNKAVEKAPTGTASQRKFAIKPLQQLNDQNSPDVVLRLAMLQRIVQAEHLAYTASRPSHGISQQFLVQTVNALALSITNQMQLHQKDTLELMQSRQKEMVIKLNELNLENLTKIIAMNQENLKNKMAAVMRNGC